MIKGKLNILRYTQTNLNVIPSDPENWDSLGEAGDHSAITDVIMGTDVIVGTDVIMGTIASQITSLTIVYSIVYSDADQKKISTLRVTGLCAGNSPETGEFPAQMASNAENVSIWWRHHATIIIGLPAIWSVHILYWIVFISHSTKMYIYIYTYMIRRCNSIILEITVITLIYGLNIEKLYYLHRIHPNKPMAHARAIS